MLLYILTDFMIDKDTNSQSISDPKEIIHDCCCGLDSIS